MAEITAANVGKLRELTGAGLMDCKKALTEANGDVNAAVDILRKKGVASAAKKAGRAANEGVIAQYIAPGGKLGLLVEVNCETDFVAKNESFRAFCDEVAKRVANNPSENLESFRAEQVAKIGENIQISRHSRVEVAGTGSVAAYIHTGAKVGVLVEIGAAKDGSISNEAFRQLLRDITLQIAAANPTHVRREEIPQHVVDKEKEIATEQVKGKPPAAISKIVEGKLEKIYQTTCLVDQAFVKNPDLIVKDHVAQVGKSIGDEIAIRRFVRFQVGESAAVA